MAAEPAIRCRHRIHEERHIRSEFKQTCNDIAEIIASIIGRHRDVHMKTIAGLIGNRLRREIRIESIALRDDLHDCLEDKRIVGSLDRI